MAPTPKQQQSVSAPFDLNYFFRCIRRYIFTIIFSACILGCIAYVASDLIGRKTYTSSVTLAVINRGGSNSNYNTSNVNNAMKRILSVMNSNTLRSQMEKRAGKLKGTISASRVGETTLITLKATGRSAYESTRLLSVALETYPELSDYYGNGYAFRKLEHLSIDCTKGERRPPWQFAILAVFLVLAAGGGLCVLWVMYTDFIHSAEQADRLLDLPMIGTVHFQKKKKGEKAFLVSNPDIDIIYNEEIDKTATTVQRLLARHNKKILVINSLYENEGKTTITANLALKLARRGKKVVIIDTDMRRPAIHRIFDYHPKENEAGLSDYLEGKASLEQVLHYDEAHFGISQIFQFSNVTEAQRLLLDQAFQNLLSELDERMDYIILDTPPLGAVQDAEIVASYADAVLLVLSEDNDRVSEINDANDVFEEAGSTVLGGVFNMVHGDRSYTASQSHFDDYYSYYGQGNGR